MIEHNLVGIKEISVEMGKETRAGTRELDPEIRARG